MSFRTRSCRRSSRSWSAPAPAAPCPPSTPWWASSVPPAAENRRCSTPSAAADIATAAARRPTTSEPLAGVWGADGSGPLLDWLDVRQRHHAGPVEGFADEDTGLILLDLPDFDSTRAANREIVQRMVGLVDVLVWVLDPQKYADAAVHNDFLAPLASHGAVTLVVLNQVDRLPAARRAAGPGIPARDPCRATGWGRYRSWRLRADRRRRGQRPRGHPAAWWCSGRHRSQRLAADVAKAAGELRGGIRRRRSRRRHGRRQATAGVGTGDGGQRAGGGGRCGRGPTGWNRPAGPAGPSTRWLSRFRPDPLAAAEPAAGTTPAGAEPDLAAAGRCPGAGTDGRCRPGVCRRRQRRRARARGVRPSAARPGRAGSSCRTRWTRPSPEPTCWRRNGSWWWGVFNVVQWLALLLAVGGLGWLGVPGGPGLLPDAGAGGSPGGRAGRCPP